MKGCSAGTKAKGKVGGGGEEEKEEEQRDGVQEECMRWRCIRDVVKRWRGGFIGGEQVSVEGL